MPGPMIVDTHAHVFTRDCPLHAARRYTPQDEAPLPSYLDILDRHGVSHAVLVQPSFLGTDNGYLTACLQSAPERLRGVAVLAPDTTEAELERLDASGVVGLRINLFDRDAPPDLAGAAWQDLIARASARGWHVEIHTEGGKIGARLEELLPVAAKIVVDHFGRPDPTLGIDDPGFRALLDALQTGRVWVKVSAPYRCGGGDCARYAAALLAAGGPERLLWGSDWPWTQHSDGRSYRACLDWLTEWFPDQAARDRILGATAAELFRFPLPRPFAA